MITTYTFSKDNNSKNNIFSFQKSSNKPNYSKIIDNIILGDVINKNSFLFKHATPSIKKNEDANIFLANLGYTPSYYDAVNFLANYKSYNKKYTLPYKLNKMYTLSDGTPIIFYDDEIQIGFDSYKYSDFADISFINGITSNTKKIIINIFATAGSSIDINIL